ncbi:MAG: hypothetical protein HYZ50_14535 [Deltaproteobacteria bacterium]|nr:hypothetical protein [Deltaproteobacteria bacterium]
MVLAFQGVHLEEAERCDLLKTDAAGTSLVDLDEVLQQSFSHCQVRVEASSLATLRQSLQSNIPPIVIVHTDLLKSYWQKECVHALVVIDIEDQIVLVNDPFFADAPKRVPVAEFLAAWGAYGQFTIIISLPKP